MADVDREAGMEQHLPDRLGVRTLGAEGEQLLADPAACAPIYSALELHAQQRCDAPADLGTDQGGAARLVATSSPFADPSFMRALDDYTLQREARFHAPAARDLNFFEYMSDF